jgi:hypothetical protein
MISLLLITYRRHAYIQELIQLAKNKNINLFIWNNLPPKGMESHEDFIIIKKILDENKNSKIHLKKPDTHLNSNKSITQAIDWFFSHNDVGIILEDDCIPVASFFNFIKVMLPILDANSQIKVITGTNVLSSEIKSDRVMLSDMTHVWGWVTTARVWNQFRAEEGDLIIKMKEIISSTFTRKIDRIYWFSVIKFNKYKHQNEISWYYKWSIFLWKNKILTIIPKVNLIKNIGIDAVSTNRLIGRPNLSNKITGEFINWDENMPLVKDELYKKQLMKTHYLSNWILNTVRYLRSHLYAAHKKIF